jgi:hypothetical protein
MSADGTMSNDKHSGATLGAVTPVPSEQLLDAVKRIEAWMRRRAERPEGSGFADTPEQAYIQCANRVRIVIDNHESNTKDAPHEHHPLQL